MSIGAMLGGTRADTVPALSMGELQSNRIHGNSWLGHRSPRSRVPPGCSHGQKRGGKLRDGTFQLLPAPTRAVGWQGGQRGPGSLAMEESQAANPCSSHAPRVLLPHWEGAAEPLLLPTHHCLSSTQWIQSRVMPAGSTPHPRITIIGSTIHFPRSCSLRHRKENKTPSSKGRWRMVLHVITPRRSQLENIKPSLCPCPRCHRQQVPEVTCGRTRGWFLPPPARAGKAAPKPTHLELKRGPTE